MSKSMTSHNQLMIILLESNKNLIVAIMYWDEVKIVSNIACVSGLSILGRPFGFLQRLFVLCLVCPMLPVSFSGLSILGRHFGFL